MLYKYQFFQERTGSLICKANQWASFYMIRTSIMKELNIKIKYLLTNAFTFIISFQIPSKTYLLNYYE